MSVLSHSLFNNDLTDKSIPYLTELIESARNLESLDFGPVAEVMCFACLQVKGTTAMEASSLQQELQLLEEDVNELLQTVFPGDFEPSIPLPLAYSTPPPPSPPPPPITPSPPLLSSLPTLLFLSLSLPPLLP